MNHEQQERGPPGRAARGCGEGRAEGVLHEHDKIWLLFDLLARLGELANFRVTSGAYYGTSCLLTLFVRSVSLLLLRIQVIDMYSYAKKA